jgi:hypothetical protein
MTNSVHAVASLSQLANFMLTITLKYSLFANFAIIQDEIKTGGRYLNELVYGPERKKIS